jgi:hypothetical protein
LDAGPQTALLDTCLYKLRRIAEHLKALEGLDLSDYQNTNFESGHGFARWVPDLIFDNSNTRAVDLDREIGIVELLKRLKWLGLPDPRLFGSPDILWQDILPRCIALKTLSIRGHYTTLSDHKWHSRHDFVCYFINTIVENIPETVTTLGFRLVFLFLGRLIDTLQARGSNISRIGIDLGAWIHAFVPKERMAGEIEGVRLRKSGHVAALHQRMEAYGEEHIKLLSPDSKWWLPDTRFEDEHFQNDIIPWDGHNPSRNAFSCNFYRRTGGDCEGWHLNRIGEPYPLGLDDDKHATTLEQEFGELFKNQTITAMLNKLRETADAKKDIQFFAL